MKSILKHWIKVIKFRCIIFYYDYIEPIISDRLDVERVQYLAGIKTLDQCKNMVKYSKAKKYFQAFELSKTVVREMSDVISDDDMISYQMKFILKPIPKEAFLVVNDTNLKSADKIKSDEKPIATTDKMDI